MNATVEKREQTRRFAVPWDITEWIDRSALLGGIVEDIDALDWSNPELQEALRANPAFQPRLLLVLITYAYAMGVCESAELTELYYRDAALKKLFPVPPPSPTAINRFRRDHLGLLKWSINQALKRAFRAHFDLGDAAIPPGYKRALLDATSTRIFLGRRMEHSLQAE